MLMSGRVIFEEDATSVFNQPPIRSTEHVLVARGVTHNTENAKLVLVLFAGALLLGAFYFISYAIQDEPGLGNDTPRSGEVIPSNRTI